MKNRDRQTDIQTGAQTETCTDRDRGKEGV